MTARTTMQTAVQRYLDERRRLGFELRIAGDRLMHFARFADARGHRGPLTLELQLDWARANSPRAITSARRLEIVRPFAMYCQHVEPSTAVPDAMTFGRGHRRLTPHIYTEREIADLLTAAARLARRSGLRPATYQTLFGLIAATGLRLSEALHLRQHDFDGSSGTLTVRQTKFKKSRCLPLHASTVAAVEAYRRRCERTIGSDSERPLFVSASGRALPSRTVHCVFAELRRGLGWVARGGHASPRIHDLRHTFAVRQVQRWHDGARRGETIEHGLLWLATYLGHAHISDTYWYLTGVPELLSIVGKTFEDFTREREVPNA